MKSAIHFLSTTSRGRYFAAAEGMYTVSLWDLLSRSRISEFPTIFLGGHRLAIHPIVLRCAVGSWDLGGIACYDGTTGEVVAMRDGLKQMQIVKYSPDGNRLYCCFAAGPCRVLDPDTCADLDEFPSTDNIFLSEFQDLALLSKRRLPKYEIREIHGSRVLRFERATFAMLHAAFGPDRVCLTESGGPVRCLDTSDGKEIWRYTHDGWHALRVAYHQESGDFFGLEHCLTRKNPNRLIRFDRNSGKDSVVARLPRSLGAEFCSQGSQVVTCEGDLVDVCTGASEAAYHFPVEE